MSSSSQEKRDYLIQLFLLIAIFFLPFIITISYLSLLITLILFVMKLYREERIKEIFSNSLDYYIVAFFGVALLSVVCLINSYANAKGFISNILIVFAITVCYFITKDLIKRVENIKKATKILLIQGIILAIYGIFQYFTAGSSRVSSFTGSPNTLPNYFIIIIPLAMTYFFSNYSLKERFLAGSGIIAMLICLILTFSRGGWVGFACSIIVFILLVDKKFLPWFLVVSVVSIFILPYPVLDRAMSMANFTNDNSNIQRLYIWMSSWNMFKDYPILGIGLDQFRELYPKYILWPGGNIQPHAHNLILQRFVEIGTLGGLIFLGLCFKIFAFSRNIIQDIAGYKRIVFISCLAGLIGIFMHGLFDDPFYDDGTFILIWFIIGIIGSFINKVIAVP